MEHFGLSCPHLSQNRGCCVTHTPARIRIGQIVKQGSEHLGLGHVQLSQCRSCCPAHTGDSVAQGVQQAVEDRRLGRAQLS